MKNLQFSEGRRYAKAYVPLVSEEFKDRNFLRVEVQYSPGGMNYFSGSTNLRGYRVSFTPVSRNGDGFESRVLLGDRRQSGGYVMIEQAPRYNKKRLLELSEKFDGKLDSICSMYIQDDTSGLIELIKNKDAVIVKQPEIKEEIPKMKLLTKEILDAFAKQGDCSEKSAEDVKVICKFFNPTGRGKWWATEYNPEEKMFFGYVSLFGDECDELGNFSLAELESVRGAMGLGIERDLHFPIGKYSLKEIMDKKIK